MDSRPSADTVDGKGRPNQPIAAGATYTVPVIGRGGVPRSGVDAVAINITTAKAAGRGHVTVYPCGTKLPNASNVNLVPGRAVANSAIAKLGTGGTICVYAHTSTDVIIDVTAWVATASKINPVSPARLMDSRPGTATVDGGGRPNRPIAAGETYSLPIAGRGGVPRSGVGAVAINITAAGARGPGHVTVYPCGTTVPNASNVNLIPGNAVANSAIAKLGRGGTICVYAHTTTNIIIDVTAWMATASDVTPLAPARLMDSRPGNVTVDGAGRPNRPIRAGTTYTLPVVGRGGVPGRGVSAVAINITTAHATGRGHVTVYPCGTELPNASNVNLAIGSAVANSAIAKLGNGGAICIYAHATTDVIIDVTGWNLLGPNQTDNDVVVYNNKSAKITFGGPNRGKATIRTTQPVIVGGFIVTTTASGHPYYGRVTAKNGNTVTSEEVALADLIPHIEVSLKVDGSTGVAEVADGVDNVGIVGALPPGPQLAPFNKSYKCEGSSSYMGVSNVTYAPGHFVLDADLAKFGFGLDSARIGWNPYVTAIVSLEATAKVSCNLTIELPEITLPTISFSIGPVPVWITQSMKAQAKFSASASASAKQSVKANASAFVGIVYNDGSWSKQASVDYNASTPTHLDAQATVSATVPSLTYAARMYGLLGFDVTAAPTATLTYTPLETKYLSLVAQVDASIAATLELDLKIKTYRYSHTFARFTPWGPKEVWSKSATTQLCDKVKTSIPTSECNALVSVYQHTNGPNWSRPSGWLTETDPCAWEGVVCASGHVSELHLGNNNLAGDLPADISKLTYVKALTFYSGKTFANRNRLTSLPTSIGTLRHLEELRVEENDLTTLPSSLTQIPTLSALGINGNPLTGGIPGFVFTISSLEFLAAEDLGLATLPTEIGRLTSLKYLYIGSNRLSSLPTTIGELKQLETLYVDSNNLGSLPTQIGQLTKLWRLSAGYNSLTSLPNELAEMDSLVQLFLSNNNFTTIPTVVGKPPQLNELTLVNNKLSGDVTQALKPFPNKSGRVSLHGNGCLTTTDATLARWLDSTNSGWKSGC